MLHLSRGHRDVIVRAARNTYPNECCGLLLGRREGDDLIVDEVVESENLSAHPENSFEIDMRLRLRLQRELRGTGRDIVGHYHSHPDGPAEPSARDRAEAWEPDLIWVIVGIAASGETDIAAFMVGADACRTVPLSEP